MKIIKKTKLVLFVDVVIILLVTIDESRNNFLLALYRTYSTIRQLTNGLIWDLL